MKRKFNKLHLIITTIVIALLLTIAFTSCEKETTPDSKYADYEYLDLEFYNKKRMTDKDYEKIFEAISRFEAKNINGMFKFKETTPEELNISPKLHKHIVFSFSYQTRIFNTKFHEKNSKKILRLKDGDPEDQQTIDSTYCAAYCVSALDFWTGLSKAKKYQNSQGWSNGVPPDKMDEFIKHFLPNFKVGLNVSDLREAKRRKSIITFGIEQKDGTMKGHAALFLEYNDDLGIAIVEDAQTGDSGVVDLNLIMKIYYKEE
jgi:hypothetical protein